jgi:hypothetical protein
MPWHGQKSPAAGNHARIDLERVFLRTQCGLRRNAQVEGVQGSTGTPPRPNVFERHSRCSVPPG